MQAPRTLAAAFLSAAMILTSGLALAEKGGHGHGNDKGAPGSAASSPSGEHGPLNAPGNIMRGGPQGTAGGQETTTTRADRERSAKQGAGDDADTPYQFHGSFSDIDAKSAKMNLKMRDGSERQYDVDAAVVNDLKARKDTSNMVFFSADGRRITSCAKVGETDRARVTGMNDNSLTLQTKNGETRVITLDRKSISRLKLHTGSEIDITTGGPQGGRIISREMLKKHWSDKFSKPADREVAKAAKTGKDIAGADKKRKAKDSDIDNRVADNDASKAAAGCGKRGGSGHGRAFENQMSKDASNDASGHNPPGLPHECVNPAGHTRGFCKSGQSGSECGGIAMGGGNDTDAVASGIHAAKHKTKDTDVDNRVADNDAAKAAAGCGKRGGSGHGRAFENQMAKDASNDASGHNPPGLPHECVNPAGHTRGFCKSGQSGSDCSAGISVASQTDTDTQRNNNGPEKCAKGSTHSSGHGRAYENQMAKDAANDASGHNPPGLPHECVNPAGHTRGWCKSGSTIGSSDCGGAAVAAAAPAIVTTTTGAPNASAGTPVAASPATPSRVAPVNHAPVNHVPVQNGGWPAAPSGPSAGRGNTSTPVGAVATTPAGVVPARGPVAMGGAPVRHPTRVMGAAVGPSQIRLVRPMANTPCVWRKTTVAAASYRPYRRVGTSYTSGHRPAHHTTCH